MEPAGRETRPVTAHRHAKTRTVPMLKPRAFGPMTALLPVGSPCRAESSRDRALMPNCRLAHRHSDETSRNRRPRQITELKLANKFLPR